MGGDILKFVCINNHTVSLIMKTQPYLLFVLIIASLNSCVSKKYGKHFNNQFNYSSSVKTAPSISNSQTLTASANKELIAQEELDISLNENQPPPIQYINEMPPKHLNDRSDKSTVHQTTKDNIKNKEKGKNATKRKTEPIGLASFGLFLLTVLMVLAEGAVGLSTGLGAIFILAAIVGGGISHYRIKQSPNKWKGRFFGMFTVIAGSLFLLLLGFAAFIESVFGDT